VFGSADACQRMADEVVKAIVQRPWQSQDAAEIRQMRRRLEETAGRRNIKRGPGGTVDIEFAVQMLQLKHAARDAEVLTPNTLAALAVLHERGHLGSDYFAFFDRAYRTLRNIEAHLRLMNTTARHDLPEDETELKKLAWLLNYPSASALDEATTAITRETRERFDRLFDSVERRA
jgi:glutamate-ammonia-ligase adenylyltransferase